MRGYNIINEDLTYKIEDYIKDVKSNMSIKLPKNFYIYKDAFDTFDGIFCKDEHSVTIWTGNEFTQQYPFFLFLHEIGHYISHINNNIGYELMLFLNYLSSIGIDTNHINVNDLQEVYADTFAMFYLKTFNRENEIVQEYTPIVEKHYKDMYDFFQHLLKEGR